MRGIQLFLSAGTTGGAPNGPHDGCHQPRVHGPPDRPPTPRPRREHRPGAHGGRFRRRVRTGQARREVTGRSPCEPVGGLEIAGRLGVRRETVAMWKQRGLLPPARWTVSGEDAWDWALDIEPWARETGRKGK